MTPEFDFAVAVSKSRQIQDSPRMEIDLPPLYPKQQQIKVEARRFNVLNIGRRAGKTYLGIRLALETAARGLPVGWFAPNYKYVLEVWRDLQSPVRSVAVRINATERRIELSNGGLIEIWTLESGDAGRGRKYARAIVDEAAMVPHLKDEWEKSIRPTLTDLQGDAWFLSTPQGLNYFYDLFRQGQDSLRYPDWQSWQMPSSVNPFLPQVEIEAARSDLPALVFQQEYLAEFLSGDGAVFRNVDACLTAPATRAPDHVGHLLVAGVDWAQLHDFTVVSVVCCHCKCEVALDRFNQIGWALQRARILTMVEAWRVSDLLAESNSIGSPNLETLHEYAPDWCSIRGVETTAKSKPKLIQELALAFEREKLRWLPDPVGRHELMAYEATRTEAGHMKYSAPEGGWDDTVIARALAWKAAAGHLPFPPSADEKLEAELPFGLRRAAFSELAPSARDFALMMRDWEIKEIKGTEMKHRNGWSREVVAADEDPWLQLERMGNKL